MSDADADALVLAEWWDQYIPPRRRMAVVKLADALLGLKQGYALAIHPIDPKALIDEPATAHRERPPAKGSPPSPRR